MGFAPCQVVNGPGSRAIYLVLDDAEGERWDVQFQDGKSVQELGSRPFYRLALVQSA